MFAPLAHLRFMKRHKSIDHTSDTDCFIKKQPRVITDQPCQITLIFEALKPKDHHVRDKPKQLYQVPLSRDLQLNEQTVLEIKQKNPFLIVITKPRKNFTNIRKKNHTTAVLSCSRLPNQKSHVALSRNLENKIYQKS